MSTTEHYRGKIKEIELLPTETLEQKCKEILINYGKGELESYHDTFEDCLKEDYDEQYIILGNKLFEIISKLSIDEQDDIFKINSNSDGTYDYEIRYYNNGCGFSEAIEEAFERLD